VLETRGNRAGIAGQRSGGPSPAAISEAEGLFQQRRNISKNFARSASRFLIFGKVSLAPIADNGRRIAARRLPLGFRASRAR